MRSKDSVACACCFLKHVFAGDCFTLNMAPRLRKRQIKVTEEADVKPDDRAEAVSSIEDTRVTEKDNPTESTEADWKQKDEEEQNEQDLQMDIEVHGNAPTVKMSWENKIVEEVDVHTEEKVHPSDEMAATETVESEKQPETTSSVTAVDSIEETLTQSEETKVEQDVEESGDEEANGRQQTDSEEDDSPSKTAEVVNDVFRAFFGNLNDSKTSEEIKSSLENYLKDQGLVFENLKLNRCRKFAFVDFATELDLTKALALNGEVVLDNPMNISKANMKCAKKVKRKVKVPAVDKKTKDARCLFLKNVPYNATKRSIRKLFRKAIDVRFPGGANSPNQGIAFLEFQNTTIAQKVLQRKQGVKIQGRVLIVDRVGDSKKLTGSKVDKKAGAPQTNTLLVSNLSVKANEKHLKKVFPEAISIRIRQSKFKPDFYAFVEFPNVADAVKALQSSRSVNICQKTAKVQFCMNPKPDDGKVLSKTLIVMNLAGKTTAETLGSAFDGALRGRVTVDKETGLSKRFGFVEFESEEQCKAAKEAMEDCEIDGSKVIVAYAKAKVKKALTGQRERVEKGNPGTQIQNTVTGKRKADAAPKTTPPKKTKVIKDATRKRKADAAAKTSPSEESKVTNNELSLRVGNLNSSKQFEEIKNSLATCLLNQSLLIQDIRLDRSKKHAFVDFASEMDLTKALTLNGEVILDKPMKITKAVISSEEKAKMSAPPEKKKGSEVNRKKSGGKGRKRGKGKADGALQDEAEEVETNN